MFDRKVYDDIAKKLTDAIPEKFKHFKEDTEKTFRNVLQSAFNKMDLVTREEFDIQSAVLAKARKKIDALEKQVAALEQHLGVKNATKHAKTKTETKDKKKSTE